MDNLPPLRNSLMGDPMFRMGMGILEGATPQATPPNAIRNMMGGLQGASDYRNNETDRLLQRQRMKMDLEQRQRAKEKWKFEKQDLERKEAAMKIWEDKNKQQSLPQIPGQMTPTNDPLQAGATVLDPATQQMMDNYQKYMSSLDYSEAAAAGDPTQLAAIAQKRYAAQEAMRELQIKGQQADRYSFKSYSSKDNLPIFEDKYGGSLVVQNNDGKYEQYNSGKHGHPYTASQGSDASGMRISPESFLKLEEDYYSGVDSIGRIDQLYQLVEMGDGGFEDMKNNWVARYNQFTGKNLTVPQMAALMRKGEAGKLVGEMRIELFGGGPLTDTEREFAMEVIMGGVGANKELMKQRLLQIYKTKMKKTQRQGRQLQGQYGLQPGGSTWTPEDLQDFDINRNVQPFVGGGSAVINAADQALEDI